mmetsp:Transcript_6584/g.18979  ORF Transcript_6584/g.18979 Transcript_6584/m.18979 type:complete len:184 (+) Transcript_6584:260-811(+)
MCTPALSGALMVPHGRQADDIHILVPWEWVGEGARLTRLGGTMLRRLGGATMRRQGGITHPAMQQSSTSVSVETEVKASDTMPAEEGTAEAMVIARTAHKERGGTTLTAGTATRGGTTPRPMGKAIWGQLARGLTIKAVIGGSSVMGSGLTGDALIPQRRGMDCRGSTALGTSINIRDSRCPE